MNIRIFQIVVPALALLIILWQVRKIFLSKAVWEDVWPSIAFALLVGIIALFPDMVAKKIAALFDFKSKVNAILFLLIGILFISLIQLFNLYRVQQKSITRLTQELSILMAEKKNTLP